MTKGIFHVQVHCDNCSRYKYEDSLELPIGYIFKLGCKNCRNIREIYISIYMKIGDYQQYSIGGKETLAFGYTRVT